MALADCSLLETDFDRHVYELFKKGFFVVENYWDASRCERIRNEMDDFITARPENVWTGSDQRIFGFEEVSADAQEFKVDPTLERIGHMLTGIEQKCLFVMANRLKATEGELRRSGGNWHRDRLRPQFKAMVYLSDVKLTNGPFSIFEGSDRLWPYAKISRETDFNFESQRWSQNEFHPFLAAAKKFHHVFEARSGTLIVFNSSLIHSGIPIEDGSRYAMTNYYYGKSEIDIPRLQKKYIWSVEKLKMPEYQES
ncbi:phytanoyl-CoA dioxygenase family protein [Parasphingopyxis algicola]|uniref:phytanoyl-CoA dioxygenase family protein n=1 Tax=Parasphingopyxis algicola TaxID=2026624 RepID=UPI0015A47216|nr:phytanoyl-CoA dioxygenase family protein [Parasphingopyxis algicola]QLC26650.1 phytanoyl-CoA dioxygenase family protein [Parasphingopyxis algicola]